MRVLAVVLFAGLASAQTYTYDVVSIHPSTTGENNSRIGPGPQGGMRAQNTSVMSLLTFAYDVRGFQFVDVPSWVWSERYDVSFTPDRAEKLPEQGTPRNEVDAFMSRNRQRLQAVLRDRFSLILRAATRTMPVYGLSIAKNGQKLTPGESGVFPSLNASINDDGGRVTAKSVSIKMLADLLSSELDRPVVNETALDGTYDFKLEWAPEIDNKNGAGGPSIFTALTEQLGLRLESKKAPAAVYVIEKIEKPGGN